MKSRERTVYFYELTITSSTRRAGIEGAAGRITISEAMDMLFTRRVHDFEVEIGTSDLFEVADTQYDAAAHRAVVLINHADKRQADPIFKDFSTRSTRAAGKRAEEGIDVSAHAILQPVDGDPYKALLLLTYGTGVTANLICKILRDLMKAKDADGRHREAFYFDHPSSAEDDEYHVRYSFTWAAYNGQLLQDALNTGTLGGVELISNTVAALDDGGGFAMAKSTIQLKPIPNRRITVASIQRAIRALANRDINADSIRITFKDESDASRIETFAPNELEAAFAKKSRLEFQTDLHSQYSKISVSIRDKMLDLL